MKDIAKFFVSKLIASDRYNNPKPYKGSDLLFPPFLEQVNSAIKDFNVKYPNHKVVFVETYRSNALQLQHYKNKASDIKKDGMHHFGIATDNGFEVNGKFTYEGDYDYLRECFTKHGLFLLYNKDIGHVQGIKASTVEQNRLRKAVTDEVKLFQRANGLVSDGIVGPKTIAKAKEIFK